MKRLIRITTFDRLAVGDVIVLKRDPEVRRIITDVYEDSYEWRYEDVPDKLFDSANSNDTLFLLGGWEREITLKSITQFCVEVDAASTQSAIRKLRDYLHYFGRQHSLIDLHFMCEHIDAKAKTI